MDPFLSPHKAIISENYAAVVEQIKKSEINQEFFTDVSSQLLLTFKCYIWRWPDHVELIRKLTHLEGQRVSFIEMRALFPGSIHTYIHTHFSTPRWKLGTEHSFPTLFSFTAASRYLTLLPLHYLNLLPLHYLTLLPLHYSANTPVRNEQVHNGRDHEPL